MPADQLSPNHVFDGASDVSEMVTAAAKDGSSVDLAELGEVEEQFGSLKRGGPTDPFNMSYADSPAVPANHRAAWQYHQGIFFVFFWPELFKYSVLIFLRNVFKHKAFIVKKKIYYVKTNETRSNF